MMEGSITLFQNLVGIRGLTDIRLEFPEEKYLYT